MSSDLPGGLASLPPLLHMVHAQYASTPTHDIPVHHCANTILQANEPLPYLLMCYLVLHYVHYSRSSGDLYVGSEELLACEHKCLSQGVLYQVANGTLCTYAPIADSCKHAALGRRS